MDFTPERLNVCVWGRVVYKINEKHNLGQNRINYKMNMHKTNNSGV